MNNSERLPDNDPEALEELRTALSSVLQVVSARGPTESLIVQNLLASLMSSTSPESNEPPPTAIPEAMSSVTETDLSQLVAMRSANQSRESAESVRNPKGKKEVANSDETSIENQENSLKKMKKPSERQMLAQKICEILHVDSERGTSTGLNRKTRWQKAAAGSISANDRTTGNAANAQAAARTGASAVSDQDGLICNVETY